MQYVKVGLLASALVGLTLGTALVTAQHGGPAALVQRIDDISPPSPTPGDQYTPYPTDWPSPSPVGTTSAPPAPAPSSGGVTSPAPAPAPAPTVAAQPPPPPPPTPLTVARLVVTATWFPAVPGFTVNVQPYFTDGSDDGYGSVPGSCGTLHLVAPGIDDTYSGCTAAAPGWSYANHPVFSGTLAHVPTAGSSYRWTVTMTYQGAGGSASGEGTWH